MKTRRGIFRRNAFLQTTLYSLQCFRTLVQRVVLVNETVGAGFKPAPDKACLC
jgi:hypothetical protein